MALLVKNLGAIVLLRGWWCCSTVSFIWIVLLQGTICWTVVFCMISAGQPDSFALKRGQYGAASKALESHSRVWVVLSQYPMGKLGCWSTYLCTSSSPCSFSVSYHIVLISPGPVGTSILLGKCLFGNRAVQTICLLPVNLCWVVYWWSCSSYLSSPSPLPAEKNF